jgi:hypothetical protein
MLSVLAFSLLLAGGAPEMLDGDGLTAAIRTAREAPANHGEALVGRHFRITVPVVYGDRQNLKTYKSPARWRYNRGKAELEITVGLGEISAQNYDQFDQQGLAKLPALQTTYFHVEERKVQTAFEQRAVAHREFVSETGIRSLGISYGLATPYPESGQVGLPSGFKPLMISRIKVDPASVSRVVDGMTMVIEGEITPLANGGPLICGGFHGMLQAENITGDKLKFLTDQQCFLTARIDTVSILAGKNSGAKNPLLKRWTK